jgi:ABC-type glycerol-3-phosphate transport system substrate-binding protein
MFKKLMAASLVAAMAVGMAGCGNTPADGGASTEPAPAGTESEPAPAGTESEPAPAGTDETVEPEPTDGGYTVINDPATGKPYDLGGMEIIVRNWWAPAEAPEPQNEYEEARLEYREWAMETYNFTIKEAPMGDWGSAPQDFVDYVSTGGDEYNYVFTLRDDPAVTSGMAQGLMYDLATLDCLDFTETKFTANKVHELYAKGGKIFAMNAGYSEPRGGMWFNKRLLTEAGIDPESIYDMQAAGTWTWDAWTDMMEKVQRDINNDGVIDVYGMDANYGIPVSCAVYSNYSEYVGLEDGKYVYKFEDPATVEALEWIAGVFKNYGLVRPADAQWDYYKEAFVNGYCAFCPDEAYMGTANQPFADTADEIGFVMFPKGPQADDYINCWTNNSLVIPACYDADRAWKIAFAWDQFTAPVPGFEDYLDLGQYRNNNFDDRAVDETCVPMMEKGMITYHALIPNLDMGAPFLYTFGQSANTVVSEALESNREAYKAWIDEANK